MSGYLSQQVADGDAAILALDQELAGLREQLTHLGSLIREKETERAVIQARVAAYKDALSHIADNSERSGNKRRPFVRRNPAGARSLSKPWQRVLSVIASKWPETVSGTTIYGYCAKAGIDAREDTIRAQLAGYVNKGYLERTEPGQFRVSREQLRKAGVSDDLGELIREAFGPFEKGSAAPTAEPFQNPGPATGRGTGFPSTPPEGSIPSGSTSPQSPRTGGFSRELDDEIPF